MPLAKKLQKIGAVMQYGRGIQGKQLIATLFCKHAGLLTYRGESQVVKIPTNPPGAPELHLRDTGPDAILFAEILAEKDYSALHQLDFKPRHIFDIGANIGIGSFYLRSIFPEATLDGFEPAPAEREILQRNYANWGRASVHPFALGKENDDQVPFAVHADKTGGQHLVHLSTDDNPPENAWNHIPVVMRRMDHLIQENSLPIPDLVKMDIEGGEADALDGFGNLLSLPRAYILETHSTQLHQYCIDKLSSAGFHIASDLPRSRETHILLMVRPATS